MDKGSRQMSDNAAAKTSQDAASLPVGALRDRICLLTGGGGDIGTASALAFARAGAKVVVTDSRSDAAEKTADLIRRHDGDAISIPLDVLDEGAVEAAVDRTVQHFGAIDVLFNLAGDTVVMKSVDCPIDDFDRVLRLNVTGQFLTARAAARRMIARGRGGSIINMSSILGYGGIPRRAAYSASRAAMINLTRTLAIEWALDGIRVNCVAPGWTMTRSLEALIDAGTVDLGPLVERTPMGRLPVVDEVADVALFLASDASRMVTGVTIPIDGGVTAYMGPGGKPSLA